MKRKTKIRFAIIVPALLIFSIGAWVGINVLIARKLSLPALIEIGDVESISFVCRWDPQQVNRVTQIDRFHFAAGATAMNVSIFVNRPLLLCDQRPLHRRYGKPIL